MDHWSVPLDLKVLWLTLVKVCRRDGVSAEGEATMSEFMGVSSGWGEPDCSEHDVAETSPQCSATLRGWEVDDEPLVQG